RPRRRGQAWFEHPGLPASSCGAPVSVGPAVSVGAGDGVGLFAIVRGVVVPIRGGSVIFGALTVELACSAVLAHVLVGRSGVRASGACLRGPLLPSGLGPTRASCVVRLDIAVAWTASGSWRRPCGGRPARPPVGPKSPGTTEASRSAAHSPTSPRRRSHDFPG